MTKRKQPADNAQRDRVITDLDTCFLVEAAAGTGKTTLLVERIMAILQKGTAPLPEIAAITFTEKAAGEMKVRLREAIEKAMKRADAKTRPRLRQALADLDGMTVSTIHSFCADLIRERPVEAGVDPGFSVADELTASLIQQDAWEAWLAEELSHDNPVLRRAIELGMRVEAYVQGGSDLPALAGRLIEQRDLVTSMTMAPAWHESDFAGAAERIRSMISDLVTARDMNCIRPDMDRGAQQIADLQNWSMRLEGRAFDEVWSWLRQAPSIHKNAGNQGNWSSKDTMRDVKTAFAELLSAYTELQNAVSHRILCDLVDWMRPFLERCEEAKAQRRTLDFQDLLLFARDMLARSKPARNHFKRTYRYVLVDEFQDTDPLQTEIIFFLCEKPNEHAPDWESVNLFPGKLFIVGDPKQSIYGFRRADLDLYGRVREAIARQGEILNLSVNFRAVPKIIHEVNAVFEPLMRGSVNGRFEPEHVPLVPYRESAEDASGVVFLCPPPGTSSDELNISDWRRKESGCIAAHIREMVERGTNIFDHQAGRRRPLKYRDVAVLYRSTTGLAELEDALRAHDVPYQVAGGKHYYTRLEFQDLLCVLNAIDNPYDAASVVGALRSPFFGHSDEDLLAHFAAGGGFNYLEDVPAACDRLSSAFITLHELHRLCRTIPTPSVLTELFERTQALQIYAMKPHGEQRVANLLKVQDMARALAETGMRSFGGFVRWLSQMESTGQAEGESPMAESDEDFVRLMTFHKAKGLEFPVVVLAHLGSDDKRSDTINLDRTTHRLDLNFGRGKKTLDWEQVRENVADRQEHERMRLFYVAMTRARDILIVPAYWSKKPDYGFLKYLVNRYVPTKEKGARCDGTGARVLPTGSLDIDKTRTDTFRVKPSLENLLPQEARDFLRHRMLWSASIGETAQRLNNSRKLMTATEAIEAVALDAEEQIPTDEGGIAATFGRLVHRLFEIVDFSSPGDLAALALAEARTFGLSSAAAQEAAELVAGALRLPLLRDRVARSEQVYKEVPFAVARADELLEGRVDLIFIEDRGTVIIDYKTDNVTEQEAAARAEKFLPQARVYVRGMQAALDMPVREVIFLFVRPGIAVSLPEAIDDKST